MTRSEPQTPDGTVGGESGVTFIAADAPHRHDFPSRGNAGDLARCASCGRWFFALTHSVWRGPNTHWSPVSWWNWGYRRRITAHTTPPEVRNADE